MGAFLTAKLAAASDTESKHHTSLDRAPYRPFVYKGQVHVTHWVKLGWDVMTPLPANAECFSQGWGDLHSCSHMAVSRLDFDNRQLVLVYFFDKALDVSAWQRQALSSVYCTWVANLAHAPSVEPCDKGPAAGQR